MRKRGGTICGVGGAIDSLLKESEIDSAIRPHRAVVLWPEIVGDVLAAVSEAEVVRAGVLFVRARSTSWANELTFYKADLVQKLNQRLGARVIQDIHFKAGGRRPAVIERKAKAPAQPAGPTEEQLSAMAIDLARLPRVAGDAGERMQHIVERVARAQAWKRAQGWRACALCGTLYAPDGDTTLCALCKVRNASVL